MRSPLDEADLTKDEIRELSRLAGLKTWDEPASACLSSRIPYGTEVTDAALRQIEAAERLMRDLGFRVCRVRHHDTVARLEIARSEMAPRARPRGQRQAGVGDQSPRLPVRQPRPAGLPAGEPERGASTATGVVTPGRLLAALALVFALAHVPFLATSLEDIDSVNFALGLRDFNVAEHRPHPPGYPVYIALGKVAKAVAAADDERRGVVDRRARALRAVAARGRRPSIGLLVSRVFGCLAPGSRLPAPGSRLLDISALQRHGDHDLLSVVLVSRGEADERFARPGLRARRASVPAAGLGAASTRG